MKCLICGKKFKRVCRHAQQAHDVPAREYKEMFGLDVKRGLLSDEDRLIMSEHTKENGTINNLKAGKKYWFKKGDDTNYKRSKQTIERVRELGKRTGKTNIIKAIEHNTTLLKKN